MAADLIDEYLLFVHPLVLGTGRRLFSDGAEATRRLANGVTTSAGVLIVSYEPMRSRRYGGSHRLDSRGPARSASGNRTHMTRLPEPDDTAKHGRTAAAARRPHAWGRRDGRLRAP